VKFLEVLAKASLLKVINSILAFLGKSKLLSSLLS